MKLLFTAMLADGRGSLNGTTFSRNKGGNYARNKTTPLNPQTAYQTAVRNYFGAISQAWRALTQAQRNAWEQSASNFPYTDVFGKSLVLSGSQLHEKLNLNLLNAGQAVLTAPPAPGTINYFTGITLTANTTGGAIELGFTPAIQGGDSVLLYATEPLSPGKKFVKNLFRQIEVLDNTDLTPYDFVTSYTAKFGALPAVGQKVAVKTRIVDNATGLSGIELTASAIAV